MCDDDRNIDDDIDDGDDNGAFVVTMIMVHLWR